MKATLAALGDLLELSEQRRDEHNRLANRRGAGAAPARCAGALASAGA